jgi:hypothetical protein
VVGVSASGGLLQYRHLCLAGMWLGIAAGVATPATAQSRAAMLSVSVVVVPRCTVDATWPTVALRCSGHAARTARVMVAGQPGQPRVQVAQANRLNVVWRGDRPAESLLLVDF